jgi:putative addiction module killer protein
MIIKFSCKFETWFKALKNKGTRAAIHNRFSRILINDRRDFKCVRNEIFELRLDAAKRYLIYFCYDVRTVIILYAGIKRNQSTAFRHAINIRKETYEKKIC